MIDVVLDVFSLVVLVDVGQRVVVEYLVAVTTVGGTRHEHAELTADGERLQCPAYSGMDGG